MLPISNSNPNWPLATLELATFPHWQHFQSTAGYSKPVFAAASLGPLFMHENADFWYNYPQRK
jgi:hypothetical protein